MINDIFKELDKLTHYLKIEEKNGAFDSLNFNASTYMAGGEESGFSCPDNLAFDFSGNLWINRCICSKSHNR